jgi:hypothetical protein
MLQYFGKPHQTGRSTVISPFMVNCVVVHDSTTLGDTCRTTEWANCGDGGIGDGLACDGAASGVGDGGVGRLLVNSPVRKLMYITCCIMMHRR